MYYFKRLFRKGVFVATLYLQTAEPLDPESKVEVFGSFTTKKPWEIKIECKYDPFFKCFKADKVLLSRDHQFKFIVDEG